MRSSLSLWLSLGVLVLGCTRETPAPVTPAEEAKAPQAAAPDRLFEPGPETARLELPPGASVESVPNVTSVRILDPKIGRAKIARKDEVEFELLNEGETQLSYELQDGSRINYILVVAKPGT